MSLKNLPDVQFCETDTSVIEQSVITVYEGIEKKTLYPGDPVRLFLESLAATIAQQRQCIDFAGKQNLLKYSSDEYLEHLGAFTKTERLQPQKAMTVIRASTDEIHGYAVPIEKGTQLTPDKKLWFETVAYAEIPAGSLFVDVIADCLELGDVGNGFVPGQIATLASDIPDIVQAENITVSSGGAVVENDASYSGRIHTAPESFSVAGPNGAYAHHAKSAHQSIGDVAVFRTEPISELTESQLDQIISILGITNEMPDKPAKQIGVASWLSSATVNLCPLLSDGSLPDQAILDLVEDKLNDRAIRPLTDKVVVAQPVPVSYDIELTYYISEEATLSVTNIQTAVQEAVNGFVVWQKNKLGRDINPSKLIHLMVEAGVSRVELVSPSFTGVDKNQVALATSVLASYGGLDE